MAAKKKTTTKKPQNSWGGKKAWTPPVIIKKPRFKPDNGWIPQFQNVFDFAVKGKGHGALNAVAGSGKTTALVELAYQYVEAFPYHKVLAIAFNSSIRKELQSRMPDGVSVATCHSFGYKSIIKMWGNGRANFDLQGARGFVIQNLAENEIGYGKEKEDDRDALCHAVSLCKTRLASNIEEVIEVIVRWNIDSSYPKEEFAQYVLNIMNHTKNQPGVSADKRMAITFDDQVWLPIVNNWPSPDQYDLVLVDEAQDLSPSRTEIARRSLKPDGRMIVVGDKHQCVSVNSMIDTPSGKKIITDLKVGDEVLSYRNGDIVPQYIKHIDLSSWNWGVKIITESGRSISMSPNHKLWATEIPVNEDEFLIYLMFRRGMGFRVGVTNRSRTKEAPYGNRMTQEGGDKMWILNKIKDREEAILYEEYISLKYGIPTAVFNATSRDINQVRVDKIFKLFGANGLKLLADWNFNFSLPHVIGAGSQHGKKIRHVIRMIAHIKSKKYSTITFEWSGENKNLTKYNPTKCKSTPNYDERFRIRKCFNNYRHALKFAEELQADSNAELSRKLSMPNDEPILMMQASQLHVGMKIPVINGESLKLEAIVSIERVDGSFIDLDVDDASNFFSDGILTHNSIYGFAGADIHALPDITKELNATELPLTCSFRCAKNIVREAKQYNPAIEHAPNAPDGIVETVSPAEMIKKVKAGDAIVSRTNAILVKVFFRLAKRGTKVRMLGKDFAASIGQRVSSWQKKAKKAKQKFTAEDLIEKNSEWLNEQIKYLKKKKLSTDRAEDEHDTINSLCEDLSVGLSTEDAVKEVLVRISTIFSADEEPGGHDGKSCVTLSSTHKFKGLERDHIYLMWDTYRPGEIEEETHLAYVAVTRAKTYLTYVRGKFTS
jgi:superfamily I DNA/RNA helicase